MIRILCYTNNLGAKYAFVFNTKAVKKIHYLYAGDAINKRRIKRSQVLATLPKDWQEQISAWAQILDKKQMEKKRTEQLTKIVFDVLKENNGSDFDLTINEFKLYLLCYEKPFEGGEIYELLCEIERTLHAKIKAILTEKYRDRWWKDGIPLAVREECATRSERDREFLGHPAYDYITLGELKSILQTNSKLFKTRLPLDPTGKEPNMESVSKSLDRLTKIRNKVMHPIGAKRWRATAVQNAGGRVRF